MQLLKKFLDRVFTLHFATGSLATLFFLSAILLNSCKKDALVVSTKPIQVDSSLLTSNISIEEAKNFFGNLNLNDLNSVVHDSVTPFYVKIEPNWTKAFVSHSTSGREIVIVPIADTTLMAKNGGKANAQLVFSKSGNDSIYAQILLTAATPAYHAANANHYNLNNFSGAFVFCDIHCNFQFGVVMNAGVPVSFVDSVGRAESNKADDRTLICTQYLTIWQECRPWEWALQECEYEFTIYTLCNETPTGGGGSGGGTGGGGAGGGLALTPELLNQWAWLAPFIESGQLNYNAIFTMGIPIHIFLYFGGELPPNFDMAAYNQLLQLNNICTFNDAQFSWVSNHASLIPLMINFLNQHNNGPNWIEALKDVIDARIGGTEFFSWANMVKLIELQEKMNLSEEQLRWVIDQSVTSMPEKAIEVLYTFTQSKDFAPEAISIAKFMIELETEGELPINYQSGKFQQIISQHDDLLGEEDIYPDPVMLWTIAYEVEKAKLKFQNPNKYSGTLGGMQLGLDAAWNVSIEGIHIALDGIGLLPVVGEVADLTNGVLYVMGGDWTNGTLSVASAVPFVGWYSTGAKYANKVVTASGSTAKLVWIVDNAGKITFGNRKQLKTILKPAIDNIAHHVLPIEHASHDVIQLAAKVDGLNPWHMNELLNGFEISLARHSGSHFNYNAAVGDKLNDILTAFPNISPSLAREKCELLAKKIKDILNENPLLIVNDPQIATLIRQIDIN